MHKWSQVEGSACCTQPVLIVAVRLFAPAWPAAHPPALPERLWPFYESTQEAMLKNRVGLHSFGLVSAAHYARYCRVGGALVARVTAPVDARRRHQAAEGAAYADPWSGAGEACNRRSERRPAAAAQPPMPRPALRDE